MLAKGWKVQMAKHSHIIHHQMYSLLSPSILSFPQVWSSCIHCGHLTCCIVSLSGALHVFPLHASVRLLAQLFIQVLDLVLKLLAEFIHTVNDTVPGLESKAKQIILQRVMERMIPK